MAVTLNGLQWTPLQELAAKKKFEAVAATTANGRPTLEQLAMNGLLKWN